MISAQLAALCAFAFVSSITPGPNNLMLMASGTNFGVSRTIPHLLGVTLGFMLLCMIVSAGLGQIVIRAPGVLQAMKWASIAYLCYLAWGIATAVPQGLNSGERPARPMSFQQAALFQWINPKAWTMALTGMTVYAPEDGRVLTQLLTVAAFGAVNMPCCLVWAAAGAQARRLLATPGRMRIFNLAAALALIATVVPVALEELGAFPPATPTP